MKLESVVPWGRSFDEYRRMFSLGDAELRGRLLGCGDGPASFNCEATALGYSVRSCDPIYAFSAGEISRQVEACYPTIVGEARKNAHRFVWREFSDPDALGRARLSVMHRFLSDYEAGRNAGRYIAAALPQLPFVSDQFDLCVCSHFLFLYSEQLDIEFHLAAITEMLRVAREVRVFPLLNLDGVPSPHIDPVRAVMQENAWQVELQRVEYEFQKGGNRMMVVKKR